mmetsp:Transcript_1615/g.3969  ORF Transcript_1615/g.3969 Transcript_1615/m.3969 type:complete len:97 (-) Transcript_1615:934-1224(-)
MWCTMTVLRSGVLQITGIQSSNSIHSWRPLNDKCTRKPIVRDVLYSSDNRMSPRLQDEDSFLTTTVYEALTGPCNFQNTSTLQSEANACIGTKIAT